MRRPKSRATRVVTRPDPHLRSAKPLPSSGQRYGALRRELASKGPPPNPAPPPPPPAGLPAEEGRQAEASAPPVPIPHPMAVLAGQVPHDRAPREDGGVNAGAHAVGAAMEADEGAEAEGGEAREARALDKTTPRRESANAPAPPSRERPPPTTLVATKPRRLPNRLARSTSLNLTRFAQAQAPDLNTPNAFSPILKSGLSIMPRANSRLEPRSPPLASDI